MGVIFLVFLMLIPVVAYVVAHFLLRGPMDRGRPDAG